MVPSQIGNAASPPAGQPSHLIEGQPGNKGDSGPEKKEDQELLDELMSNARNNPELFQKLTAISTSNLVWTAVHGNLCLALRHPANQGPSRMMVLEFTRELGVTMVKAGCWSLKQLREIEKVEMEEGSHDFEPLCSICARPLPLCICPRGGLSR